MTKLTDTVRRAAAFMVMMVALTACAHNEQAAPDKQGGSPATSGLPGTDCVAASAASAWADCAYLVEIYAEYKSAPTHGVEREITRCLNRAAVGGN